MNELNKIKSEIDKRKGKLELINNEINSITSSLTELREELRISKSAQKVLQTVARETQAKIEYRISNLITTCIQNLGKNYKFVCEFVTRRDKTECDLYLTNETGEKLEPFAEVGGSIVQIIDFALRCTLWSLQKNKVNNFLFLDEPFSGVKNVLYKRLKKIVGDISKNLKLQINIITHDDELKQLGDKVIYLSKDGNNLRVCSE